MRLQFLLTLMCLLPGLLRSQVIISEFMASNGSTLADADGNFSDWIELYHQGTTAVALAGWALTDDDRDPAKWVFPDVTLEAGQFLVVFASGKDRRDPESELHANFRLSQDGEFLALIAPNGAPGSLYSPRYPAQLQDFSYGTSMELEVRKPLREAGLATYLVPRDNALGTTWTEPGFDDTAWVSGPSGIGFDSKTSPTYLDLIGTDVSSVMQDVNAGIYTRFAFDVDEDILGGFLRLRMKYADGVISYLNGVEVARRNVRSAVRHNSGSLLQRPVTDARTFDDIRVRRDSLWLGRNVLAIHSLNRTRDSEDHLILPVVESVEVVSVNTDTPMFLAEPTPASPNAEGRSGVSAEPEILTAGGAYVGRVEVEVLASDPGMEIRYTLDGLEPTASSQLYSGPLAVEATSVLNVKGFQPGRLPSSTVSNTYLLLEADLADFSSDLPIFVVNTFGQSISSIDFRDGHLLVLDTGEDGRASLGSVADFSGKAAFEVRGSSTEGRSKKAYKVEIRDRNGNDRRVSILGLSEDSDWILYAPFNFDRAMIRNAFIYELSNQVGRYAVRTRFCEVFVNTGTGPLSQSHHVGLYVFMEKIKRGPHRVDIERLLPADDSEPEITGGYMFKIDRIDSGGDTPFTAGGQDFGHVDPKQEEITDAQVDWLQDYINAFVSSLDGPNEADPQVGYPSYIDVPSWIDHYIINELAKNPDGLQLSTYLFKDRGGRLHMGPVWDFDRTMGSDEDLRSANPETGSTLLNRWIWSDLFEDEAFWQQYRSRWKELRRGPIALDNVLGVIDSMASEIAEAAPRNYEKWRTILAPDDWPSEIEQLKTWLTRRIAWMDRQYTQEPALSPPAGPVEEGAELTMVSEDGDVYYTLNGSDPMASDDSVAPEALLYTGAIVIREDLEVRARTRTTEGIWSGLTEATYFTGVPPLVVTELMYHPLPDSEGNFSESAFEFIEIQHRGDEVADLASIHFAGRVQFEFNGSDVTELAPGEYVVVVNNKEAFTSRYGSDGIKIAGEFSGEFNNQRHVFSLRDERELSVITFVSEATWYPSTAGEGYSLVIRDPAAPRDTWRDAESWRPSLQIGGSPGRADTEAAHGLQIPGDINQDGRLNIADTIGILGRLFPGSGPPLPCGSGRLDEAGNQTLLDLNGDGTVNIADAQYTLNFIFRSGPLPVLGFECVEMVGCPNACGLE